MKIRSHKLKIVLVGTQRIGHDSLKMLLAEKYDVLAVITSKPDSHEKWDKNVLHPAENNKIPIYYDDEFHSRLIKKIKPDIIVVAGYRKIIPNDILKIPKYGVIGLHASLLPKYKGFAPINWAIINGDDEVGITLFKIIEKTDEGEILGQSKIRINQTQYIDEIKIKIFKEGIKLLKKTLFDMENDAIVSTKQIGDGFFCCKRIPEDGLVNWSKSNRDILNLMRGSDSDYPAFTFYNNSKIFLIKAKLEKSIKYVGTCGQVARIFDNGDVIIITNDGALRIELIRDEFGNYVKPSKLLNKMTIRLKPSPTYTK